MLNAEHLRLAHIRIDLALELPCGAVHGLDVDHREAVVDRHAGALVLRQVVIRVGLADGEGLPHAALAVIRHGARHGEGLRIHVVHALGQWVAAVHRHRFHLVDLAQLPGDVGETAALTAERHHLVTVAVLVRFAFPFYQKKQNVSMKI